MSKIQWTDRTWNPIRARNRKTGKVGHYCELVSSGCANCYASAMQRRFGLPSYAGPSQREARLEDVEVFLDEEVLQQPFRWKKPSMVFVCSMTDLFGEWVRDEWIDKIFVTMTLAKHHTFQVLTKRPKRMRDFFGNRNLSFADPNIWIGVSVENQEQANERMPYLIRTAAAVRFLSVEPLLGPIDLNVNHLLPSYYDWRHDIHWVIVGGESGRNTRSCDIANVRDIVRQCYEDGVPCFVKQLGAKPFMVGSGSERHDWPCGYTVTGGDTFLDLRDPKGGDISEWPEDLRVREYPEVGHDCSS